MSTGATWGRGIRGVRGMAGRANPAFAVAVVGVPLGALAYALTLGGRPDSSSTST
jgi:hypothetical protein